MYGEPGYWSGSYDDDGNHCGYQLKPCPFCGSDENLSICNTHTPLFWVECECRAEMEGAYIEDAQTHNDKDKAYKGFKNAMACAYAAWNERSGKEEAS